ncbi:proton-conducting transporter membrane subunit [Accumulibacter sp.]|uniref:proton-conducting transporter transmembrane domain-containing protein n=1 Tax=Accumulibacter sp. TaxID=2053492 RepID=UPI0025FF2F84|nr:proton-conducting transporter membrane subunit [Accumulibacter sp.]
MILHPALILVLGALVLPWLPHRGARQATSLALPLAALWAIWQVPDGSAWQLHFLDYTLTPARRRQTDAPVCHHLRANGRRWRPVRTAPGEPRGSAGGAFYAGSAIGVAFAGDLITVFIFWELMAIGSTLVIWSAGSRAAYSASMRYLSIHLLGGVVLMAGIAGHVADTGSVAFTQVTPDSLASWLILAGFLINAGAPPLSAWLPDAYPEASWSGTVFLSAFTTKTAVYVLLRGFPARKS